MTILEQFKHLHEQILAESKKQQKELNKELGQETTRIVNKLHPIIQDICNVILEAYDMTQHMSRVEFDIEDFLGISHIQCSSDNTPIFTEEDKMRGLSTKLICERQHTCTAELPKEKRGFMVITFNTPKFKDYALVIGNPGYREYENGNLKYVDLGEYLFNNSRGRLDHADDYIYFEPNDPKYYKSTVNWDILSNLENAFDDGLADEIMRNIYLSIYDNLSSLDVDNKKLEARIKQIVEHKNKKEREEK